MKNSIFGLLLLVSTSVFANITDQWNEYYLKTDNFVWGGIYPVGMADTAGKKHFGQVGVSALNPVTAVVFGGFENYSKEFLLNYGVIHLQINTTSNQKSIIGTIQFMAGKTKKWKTSSFGDHACEGEEEVLENNIWKLNQFSFESLLDYALNKATEACIEAGGIFLDYTVSNTSHYRLRKSNFSRVIPVFRKCLSSDVVLRCDFTSKASAIKEIIWQFNEKYPNNPSSKSLEPFLNF